MNNYINNFIKVYVIAVVAMISVMLLCSCGKEEVILLTDEDNINASQEKLADKLDNKSDNKELEISSDSELEKASALTNQKLYVHISGAVNKPGVVELLEGSRLFEAIEEAGGFTEEASKDYCNLAVKVSDGEQYFVPTIEEAKYLLETAGKDNIVNGNDSGVVSHYDESGRLNINLASKDELMNLPGIGATRADAILTYRETVASFNSIEDIKNVSGIKDALFGQISSYIYVQ